RRNHLPSPFLCKHHHP
ncbi:ggdef family domain protein, partial [Vibrio harveyi]